MVSKATPMAPVSMNARVSCSSAAKWKNVKTIWFSWIMPNSLGCGSFTLMIISLAWNTSAAVSTTKAPASM